MSVVDRTIEIPASPDEVWAVLADLGSIGAWADNVDHSCLLRGGDDGSGAGIGATRRVQVGRRALVERVVIWEPTRRLAYEIEGLPPVVRRVQNEWRLEGVDGDAGDRPSRTTVTLETTVDCGARPPQKLVARLLANRLAKDSETMLAGLANSLKERTHA